MPSNSLDLQEEQKKVHNSRSVHFTHTPKSLLPYLKFATDLVTPKGREKKLQTVMIWGKSGIGKTDIIRQLATRLRARLVSMHLPQYDPTDVKGIVVRLNDDTVKWVPSSYLPGYVRFVTRLTEEKVFNFRFPYSDEEYLTFRVRDKRSGRLVTEKFTFKIIDATNKVTLTPLEPDDRDYIVEIYERAVLFLDEISAADVEVQKVALQLCLDRSVGEYNLPPTCPVIGAGNRESDGANVFPMSGPLSNRFCHIILEPSVTDWMEYEIKSGEANPEVLAFISTYGSNYLHHYDSNSMVDGKNGFPTPRSLSKLARDLNAAEDYSEAEFDEISRNSLIVGHIGHTVGKSFIGFRDLRKKLPNIDRILNNTFKDEEISKMDKPSAFLLVFILTIKMGTDMIPSDGKPDDKWVKARDGFFRFILAHMSKDVQYVGFTQLYHFYDIPKNLFVCPLFAQFVKIHKVTQDTVYGK